MFFVKSMGSMLFSKTVLEFDNHPEVGGKESCTTTINITLSCLQASPALSHLLFQFSDEETKS